MYAMQQQKGRERNGAKGEERIGQWGAGIIFISVILLQAEQ
jgi:hypothetical protein